MPTGAAAAWEGRKATVATMRIRHLQARFDAVVAETRAGR
jgi:hypothetical protein